MGAAGGWVGISRRGRQYSVVRAWDVWQGVLRVLQQAPQAPQVPAPGQA